MRKSLLLTLSLLFLVICSSGCAVQRYGRMISVVPSERRNLTCEQVTTEIEKCNAFINNVTTKNKEFTGGDVLAFLGDFGIGDHWEVTEAISSATSRISELELIRDKKCR